MKTTTIGDLPEELVSAILSRLPVKVLVLCKCVCKPWCGLIGRPDFVKQHFDHENNQQRLLIRIEVPDRARYRHALYVDESFSEYEEPSHLQIPGRPAADVSDLIGPLNGVFCVVSMSPWGPMALLNPAMRQFKPLPMVQEIDEENLEFSFSVLALGLDPSTGDYKVVLILNFWDSSEEDYHCVVNVCSSESDSWRVLEDVDPIVANSHAISSLCCTYLNGVYYWAVTYHYHTDVAILMALDMRTDRFRKIQVTGCDDRGDNYLAWCGDSLALLKCYECGAIDIWIMQNEECWIKSSRVSPLEGIRSLFCFWRNNQLLLETMSSFLALYDLSTQEVRTFEACILEEDYYACSYFIYKESLVSIKGEAGKCKLWDTSSDFIQNFFEIPPDILMNL
ncbi:hypothetical protein C2S53_007511 [Perilla frutescens var. hirtella]|uniref:F-box domain-containing protein n=1 Tax=Perilla frutescens var. hirtella TaxID=608512 RepID=A0AAD4JAR0_PERFH|nr:hypothetical protein C2S53_007511 [Perilla frutescens var. hirtella]